MQTRHSILLTDFLHLRRSQGLKFHQNGQHDFFIRKYAPSVISDPFPLFFG